MILRSIALVAAAAAPLVIPGTAQAFFFWHPTQTFASTAVWGTASTDVNLRTCGSVACSRILVVPRGAQVQIMGTAGSWYQVNYGGRSGFMSSRYVTTALAYAR
jgi:uncharacterized protein YraI